MQPSIVQTLTIPVIGNNNPSRLWQAGGIPARVLIRNTGGNPVLLAHDSADLAQLNSTGATYTLPPGQSDVIVLAPRQSLFAAAFGGGGQASVAVSEAIPVGKAWMES